MKTYADTLDDQALAASIAEHDHIGIDGTSRTVGAAIRASDSYFFSAEFIALVDAAARALPDSTVIEHHDLPTDTGWVTFAHPITLPWTDPDDRLSSMEAQGCWWTYEDVRQGVYVVVTPFALDGRGKYDGIGGFAMRVGERERPAPGFEGISVAATWLTAAWLLLGQQTVVESAPEAVPRAARRRAERESIRPTVRVIRLPRRVRERSGGESGHVDWQSRWIVSGHWRQQPWGPERKRIRPVWISPYLKGPEDKPVKAQAHRLFVAREA